MDIFQLQINDHLYYKDLLAILNESNPEDSSTKSVLNKLQTDLVAHRMAEEESFFEPMIKLDPSLGTDIALTKTEHKLIEDLINELQSNFSNIKKWNEGLSKLNELIESDIKKEEEKMLSSARYLISEDEAKLMARNMLIKKSEFENSILSRASHRIKEFVGL